MGSIISDSDSNTGNTGETVLTFGKYRGRTIADIYESDPSYCKWLIPQQVLINSPEVRAFLHLKFKNSDNSYIMTWGKFKGKTVRWIFANNNAYFYWLLNNSFVESNCPKLKEALVELHAASTKKE